MVVTPFSFGAWVIGALAMLPAAGICKDQYPEEMIGRGDASE
jgi:hypothetical protein